MPPDVWIFFCGDSCRGESCRLSLGVLHFNRGPIFRKPFAYFNLPQGITIFRTGTTIFRTGRIIFRTGITVFRTGIIIFRTRILSSYRYWRKSIFPASTDIGTFLLAPVTKGGNSITPLFVSVTFVLYYKCAERLRSVVIARRLWHIIVVVLSSVHLQFVVLATLVATLADEQIWRLH